MANSFEQPQDNLGQKQDSFHKALNELNEQLNQFVDIASQSPNEMSATDEPSALDTQNAIDLEEKLIRIESIIQSGILENTQYSSKKMGAIRKKINGILYTLVDQLHVPEDFAHRKKALCHELAEMADWDVLPRILSESTSLVFISNSSHQHELEDYLKGLHTRLSDIHQSLKESKEIETLAFEAEKSLDAKVMDCVKQLNDELQNTQDLNQLKLKFQENFESILSLIHSHQDSGFGKREVVIGTLEQLSERISSLENDAHRLHSIIEQQRADSLKDSLTGLPNRQAYEEQGVKEISRLNRYGHDLSLAVTDIDYFKKINDEHGHLAGDKALKLISDAMKIRLRTSDLIARYGGEEFVILMPDTVLDSAHLAIEHLRAAIEEAEFDIHGKTLKMTASFGITQIQPGETLEAAFARADKALYEAKRLGRNRIRIHKPTSSS